VGKRFQKGMKKRLGKFAAGVLFAALVTSAQAQLGPSNGRYRPESVAALIERVHVDLDRGYAVWHLRHGDRDRLTHAERQLRDFARRWREGKFDKGNLNGAIGSIQHVIDDNHLRGGERDALWNDVEELRRMREAYDRREIGYR
jgi:hypothetical protein